MADISNITQYILKNAEEERSKILSAAKNEYDRVMDKAKSDAAKEYDSIIESANAEAEKLMQAAKNNVARNKKNNLLAMKNNAINDVFEMAKQKLLSSPKGEYMDFISGLISKNATGEPGVVIFNSNDKNSLNDVVIKTLKDNNLTVDANTTDIDGGFILKYGFIELNCSIDAMMNEKREQFTDYISANLFK